MKHAYLDYAADGRAIGIEITAPSCFELAQLNRVLEQLGHPPATADELSPLPVA